MLGRLYHEIGLRTSWKSIPESEMVEELSATSKHGLSSRNDMELLHVGNEIVSLIIDQAKTISTAVTIKLTAPCSNRLVPLVVPNRE